MSNNNLNRRRSTRIRNNHNGTIINTNNNNNRNRLSTNNSTHQNGHGHRYSGRKRNKPEPSDHESSSENTHSTTESSSSEETQDSNYENINHNNNHKRRRLTTQPTQTQSQFTNLSSQIPSTQTRNRHKTNYKVTRGRWNDKKNTNVKRRSTRIKYRKLADDTVADRAMIVDPINNNFIQKLQQQNELYQQVHHPNEAFMDIQQAKNMTNILKEQTRTLANEHFTITPNDYVQALYHEFAKGNNNDDGSSDFDEDNDDVRVIDWAKVGERFAPCFLTVPAIQFMNGPLQQSMQKEEGEKKKRQVRQKRTFTSDVPVIQPKKVEKQKKSDKTETKSRIVHLQKILRKKCEKQDGVNPYEFLINPQSYSQTIENLFDLCFIINQGSAQMGVNDATKQPVLSYVSSAEKTRRLFVAQQQEKEANKRKRNQRNYLNKNQNNNDLKCNGQCIVKFNPSHYYNLINVYNINQSQIERDEVSSDEDVDVDVDDVNDVDEKSENSDSDNGSVSEEEEEEIKEKNKRNRKRVYKNDKEEAD